MEENSGASESDASSSDLAESNPEPESGDPDPDSNSEPSPARSSACASAPRAAASISISTEPGGLLEAGRPDPGFHRGQRRLSAGTLRERRWPRTGAFFRRAALWQRHGRRRSLRLSRPSIAPRRHGIRSRADGDARPRPGRDTRVLPGSMGQAAAGHGLGPARRGDQRLRVDREPRAGVRGDPALLHLPASVDGSPGLCAPRLGRPQEAPARRPKLDGRRAGRLGG